MQALDQPFAKAPRQVPELVSYWWDENEAGFKLQGFRPRRGWARARARA